MLPTLQKIISLAETRIEHLRNGGGHGFYKGPETFVEGIIDEMDEVKIELEKENRVFLEDELGDVLWDYICLVESLDQIGKISKEKVFDRCWTKFSERLNSDGSDNGNWAEVKKIQKERLQSEYNQISSTI